MVLLRVEFLDVSSEGKRVRVEFLREILGGLRGRLDDVFEECGEFGFVVSVGRHPVGERRIADLDLHFILQVCEVCVLLLHEVRKIFFDFSNETGLRALEFHFDGFDDAQVVRVLRFYDLLVLFHLRFDAQEALLEFLHGR